MSESFSVAAPPTTADVAASLLAYMTGQTGVVADATPGSQIRTLSEGIGNVCEVEGANAQAAALQSIIYGCWAAFGIVPFPAQQAQGSVLFSALGGNATQNVVIAPGTVVQTQGGTQFVTTTAVTLLAGTASITAPVQAVLPGAAGNVGANTITVIVSGIPYPLTVSNTASTIEGADAEPFSATQARFAAAVQEIGLASPVAIANAAIGVQAAGSTETVRYSTLYEPGVNPNLVLSAQTAGWLLYIDNGGGTASTALINAVIAKLNGMFPTETGYRDAGVPYQVIAVSPTQYSVVVTGTLVDPTQDPAQDVAVNTAIQNYQISLQFGQAPTQAQLDAVVGATLGNTASGFLVALKNSSGTTVASVPVAVTSRAQLTSTTITLT